MLSSQEKPKARRILLSFIAFGAIAYAAVMMVLSHTQVWKSATTTTRTTHSPSSSAAAGNVPNGILKKVTGELSNVSGVNELYVQAAPSGGYIVSATAKVGQAATSAQVKSLMNNYLKGLYTGSVKVSDAQIYVMQNGIIVAGAGLGANAYHSLTSTTGTAPFSLVSQLKSPGVTSEGPKNDWTESQIPASP